MHTIQSVPINSEISDFYTLKEIDTVASYVEQKISCISLHKSVNQVIDELIAGSSERSVAIINDISPELFAGTDKSIFSSIINCLLDAMLVNSDTQSIQITAKLVGNIVLLHLRSSNPDYNHHIDGGISKMENLAKSLGGCITVSNSTHGLTLAFTFINH